MRLKSSRILRFACSLRRLSLFPARGPQKAPLGRFKCFWIARAPTVSMGGLELSSSYSSLNSVYNLLNCKIIWFFSGGSSVSTLELVCRIPRHVKIPRGYNAKMKSDSSCIKPRGDSAPLLTSIPVRARLSESSHRSSARNTYLSYGVSFDSISQTSSVSSWCERHTSGWYSTGNRSNLFHRVSTTQIYLM